MLPFRFEKDAFQKEIIKALKHKDFFDVAIQDFTYFFPMFWEKISSTHHLNSLRALAADTYSNLTNLSYQIIQNLWQPNKFKPTDKNSKTLRLKDLPEDFPDEIKNHFKRMLAISEPASIQNPVAVNQIRAFISRAEKVGYRQSYAEMMNVDTNNSKNLNKTIDSLNNNLVFKNSVFFFLSKIVYGYKEVVNSLANKLSIEDCPGQWLKHHVEIQMRRNDDSNPSNELDIKHISHLPYVDIFFTDKRASESTKQVLRNKKSLELFGNLSSPIAIPNTIESLENILFS